jgi:hypothetical protein
MSAEVVPSGWLTRTRLRVLDESLARLGRGAARLRLRVGEALDQLAKCGGHAYLGFSSPSAYAHERCERGARWAAESRAMARRLQGSGGRELTVIRNALVDGTMLWSMAELVSSHATPENEAELVGAAQGRTVRQMRNLLASRVEGDVDDEDERRVLRVGVGFDELAIVEASRVLVEGLDGEVATDERLLEAMLAEAESALLGLEPRGASSAADDVSELLEQRRALAREATTQAEERAEARIAGLPVARATETEIEGGAIGSTPRELDAEIRRCCALLAARDLEIGRLCRVMFERKAWYQLGYASEGQYARERVGVSLSSLRHRCTLARRADRLPALAAALESGAIGYEATLLIGRVATPETVDPWIARARVRTLKHLREEVGAVELRMRLGDGGPFPPPEEAELEDVAALERAALSGELFKAILEARPPGRQISVRAGADRELRLGVTGDLLEQFHRLRRRFERIAPPEASFVAYLGLSLWEAWSPSIPGALDRWKDIYRRDRYRCSSPVCMRRDVTPHHLVFRSQGGGDEDENMASVCCTCHLEGIHQGWLRAEPPASRIRWTIGRDPIMVVDGRERHLIDATS